MRPLAYRRLSRIAVIAAAVLAVPPLAAPTAAYAAPARHLVDLTALDGGACCGEARDIDRQGDVVGDTGGHAFLYHDGMLTNLGMPAGYLFSTGTGINRYREVAGWGTNADGNTHALLWRPGRITDLGTLGGARSMATAVNDRGEVVGFSTVAGTEALHAFRWRDGAMTDLGAQAAYDVNDHGVVAGSILGGDGQIAAARWYHGVPTPVDPRASTAAGINDRGDVTGLTNPVGHAYLVAGGRFTEISAPGAMFLDGNGLNNRDEVVGTSDLGAWVWYRGHLSVLPALGSSAGADRINDRGQVVGWAATDHGGNPHAVVWTF